MEKRLEQLIAKKDVIGTQLVKKNDIIAHQDEKIKMLQLTLERGEKQYEQRLDDIKLLKLEVKRLRREKDLLARGIQNISDLRLEVFNLERNLNRERQKRRALEEALETPLNIQRWRKLQSSDPTSLEMMDKIKVLQSKLLNKAHKVSELNKEHAALLTSIEQARTDPEMKEEIVTSKKTIFNQQEKIKCLIAEVKLRDSQLTEYKENLDNMKKDLKIIKDKAISMKLDLLPGTPVKTPLVECKGSDVESSTKFLGGGFKISQIYKTCS